MGPIRYSYILGMGSCVARLKGGSSEETYHSNHQTDKPQDQLGLAMLMVNMGLLTWVLHVVNMVGLRFVAPVQRLNERTPISQVKQEQGELLQG